MASAYEEEFAKMSKSELKKDCSRLGLRRGGDKKQLILRLRDFYEQQRAKKAAADK